MEGGFVFSVLLGTIRKAAGFRFLTELQAVPLIDLFCFLQSSEMCGHPLGAAFHRRKLASQLSSINELRLKSRASLFIAIAGD